MIDLNQIDSDYNEKMKELMKKHQDNNGAFVDAEKLEIDAANLVREALYNVGLQRLACSFSVAMGGGYYHQ